MIIKAATILMFACIALLTAAPVNAGARKVPRGHDRQCAPDTYSAYCALHCRLYLSGEWKDCRRIPQGS